MSTQMHACRELPLLPPLLLLLKSVLFGYPQTQLQGVTSWFVFYLIKEKGVSDAAQAAVRVSGLELGGLVGSLIAGRVSDMMINSSGGKGGAVGKRVQVRCMAQQLLQLQRIDANILLRLSMVLQRLLNDPSQTQK